MSDADQPVASSGGAPKAAEPSAERSEAHNVRATATTGPQLVIYINIYIQTHGLLFEFLLKNGHHIIQLFGKHL